MGKDWILDIPVAGLFDFSPVIITFDIDYFTHLIETGAQADADTVDQRVILSFEKRIPRVFFIFTVVHIVGRKNRQFFLIVAVVYDVKDRFLYPGCSSFGPELIEN